jgi:hypothetical protein
MSYLARPIISFYNLLGLLLHVLAIIYYFILSNLFLIHEDTDFGYVGHTLALNRHSKIITMEIVAEVYC